MTKQTFAERAAYPEGEPFDTAEPKGSPIAFVELVRVVRSSEPVYGGGTGTLGDAVDDHLTKCAREGEEVQSVTLHIAEGEWSAMAEHLRSTTRPKHG